MNIDIICVGKIKESYLKDAVNEYSKRLSRYCKLNIIEVADEKTIDNQPEALDERVKESEGARIIKHLKQDAYIVCLEIDGISITSKQLASNISAITVKGYSCIQFVIGGSLGLCSNVISKADYHLSFSKMTFPHQLMRVILLEQIYRSFRIINNEPYHK